MKVKDHIEKAKHNERFVLVVEKEFDIDFIDWCITALFYSALHYLNAFITHSKVRVPTDYKKRRELLDPDGENLLSMEYIPFYAYIELSEYSHKTRYFNHYTGKVNSAILTNDFKDCKIHLDTIKEFIESKGIH